MSKFYKILIIIALSIIIFGSIYAIEQNNKLKDNKSQEYKGRVIETISVYISNIDKAKYQKVLIEVLDETEYKDQKLEADYLIKFTEGMLETKQLKKGDIVYLMIENGQVIIKDFYRLNYIMLLIAIFFLVIIVIGGIKGIKTVISLTITFLVIFFGFIPLIIQGYNAMFVAVIACIIIAIVTFLLVSGINKKTLVAMIGTITGVFLSAVIAIIFTMITNVTGLGNEEAQMLIYISKDIHLDIFGLFYAGIIIGTVGATMDITMSIASAMNEIEIHSKDITVKSLFKSGLNVGKDAMGTMSNTLILAYVGESLNLVILILLNSTNVMEMINYDFISAEILRSLCGTIGMISAIPITAFIYSLLYKMKKEKNNINV
jgi:uncharacterized membrane protein